MAAGGTSALQKEVGPHSFSLGTYGLMSKIYMDGSDVALGVNRFTDVALDGQYQFIQGEHIFSSQATWIREAQKWDASVAQGASFNSDAILNSLKVNLHYAYKRTWGGGVQYFQVSGDADPILYSFGEEVSGSRNGSPNSRGWIYELNFMPQQNIKLALRYKSFLEFNGASHDYDGFGRDAKKNNNAYLLAWVLF